MARDDWRIRVELPDEEGAHGLLGRLHRGPGSHAEQLVRELEGRRLAVSRDGGTVFVYADSPAAAESALQIIQGELAEEGLEGEPKLEHWLDEEDRWDDEPPGETWEEEELDRGYAPWEVRVESASRDATRSHAKTLEDEGYRPIRQSNFLIVGAASKEDAEALATRLHGTVELGGEVVWEETPPNPFAIFGGLGG